MKVYDLDASTRVRIDRIIQILRNRARRHSRCAQVSAPIHLESQTRTRRTELTLIGPPPIILPPDPISLPTPKDPTILLLIRKNLRREPLLVPADMTIRRCEIGIVPFEIIGDAEAKFANDRRPIAAAIVVAGFFEVGGWGLAGAGVVDAIVVGPFEVAVVVVGGEDVVGEVLVRVAGAPFHVLSTKSNS